LSIPCISSVLPLGLVSSEDDDGGGGADVDSGKEPIQKTLLILSIKIAMEKYSKGSIRFYK
jgi:hypothetical protein